jgi:hypothetical protein
VREQEGGQLKKEEGRREEEGEGMREGNTKEEEVIERQNRIECETEKRKEKERGEI